MSSNSHALISWQWLFNPTHDRACCRPIGGWCLAYNRVKAIKHLGNLIRPRWRLKGFSFVRLERQAVFDSTRLSAVANTFPSLPTVVLWHRSTTYTGHLGQAMIRVMFFGRTFIDVRPPDARFVRKIQQNHASRSCQRGRGYLNSFTAVLLWLSKLFEWIWLALLMYKDRIQCACLSFLLSVCTVVSYLSLYCDVFRRDMND